MKVKNKTIITTLIASALLGTTIAFVAGNNQYKVNAFEFSNEYFNPTNVTLTTNKSVPLALGMKDYRNGILLSSRLSNSNVTLKDAMSGKFSIDMMPYSSFTYGSNEYETNAYSNSYQDLNTLSLTFKDLETEQEFKLVLNGGAKGNNVTTNAHVEVNDEKMGVFYHQDAAALGNTKGANNNGVYTYLYGTSFSNMAVHNKIYSSANVKSLKLEFDPSTMCVYGVSYGYGTDVEQKRLIWDFSKESIDGSDVHTTISGFNKYQVSLTFEDINKDRTANLLVYEINGQKFAGTLINNSEGPRSHAVLNDGQKETKYVLPKPVAYDVLEAEIDFNGDVSVVDENGNKVDVLSSTGTVTTKYQENCYFVPTTGGKHTVSYTAYDSKNVAGETQSYEINIVDPKAVLFETTLEKESYMELNSSITIPEARVSIGDAKYQASVKVIGPDYQEKNGAGELKLNKEGLYQVIYSAKIGNVDYQDSYKIYSSVEAKSLFNIDNSKEMAYGTSYLNNDVSGLKITANRENATITYKELLDVDSLDGTVPLISLQALAKTWGVNDSSTISVKLIDQADNSNYVQVLCSAGNEDDVSFVRAGASTQKLAGLASDGTVSSNASSGTKIYHSFLGRAYNLDLENQNFEVYYDNSSKKIYTTNNSLVSDLDDSEFYTTLWDGFTSDKVELQISISGISNEEASYLVNVIDGYNVNHNYAVDKVAPVLSYDEEDFISGVINKDYPLPTVSLKDNKSKDVLSSVKVYYGEEQMKVTNNSFKPTHTGRYRIVYEGYDSFGNLSTIEKRIQVKESITPVMVFIDLDAIAGQVGTEIVVPDYYVSGGEGKKDIKITAKGKNTNTTYEVVDMKFTPLVADKYVISYEASDRLGNKNVATIEADITVSSKPIIAAPTYVPNVILDGQEITFETVTAKDYNNPTSLDVDVRVYIKIDGVETLVNGTYVPSLSKMSSEATLIYRATSKVTNETTELTYKIPAICLYDENGYLHLEQYLITNGFNSVRADTSHIELTSTTSGSSIEFIKEVYSSGFQISFNIPSSANNVDKVTLYLTDSEDENKQVKLDIVKAGSSDKFSYLIINDTTKVTMAGTFFGTTANSLRIVYDSTLNAIKDDSGLVIAYLKDYVNKEVFRGFGEQLNFKLQLGNVSGITTIRLYEIGNQIMSNVDDDYTMPSITLNDELVRQAKLNQTIVVPSANSYDVLDANTTTSIRVVDPDGEVIYSSSTGEGTTITASKYGTYYVNYVAKDSKSNQMTLSRPINVLDEGLPTITINGEFPEEVALNQKVILPEMVVSDDKSTEENITTRIFIINPKGVMEELINNTFTPKLEGRYIIRYFAIDEAGNMSFVDYQMEVK